MTDIFYKIEVGKQGKVPKVEKGVVHRLKGERERRKRPLYKQELVPQSLLEDTFKILT